MNFGKLNDPIRFAIVIVIGQNYQSIVHWLHRFPHRIGWPDSGPQASFCIYLHLHWIDQLRELLFVSKQIHFKIIAYRQAF